MEVEKSTIPDWLTALIHADFRKRKGNNNTDFKYYCVDCASKSLTIIEKKTEHEKHQILEPLKCSGCCGYRVDDIKRLKDEHFGGDLDVDIVSDVAQYTINSRLIFYPKSRRPFESYKKSHSHGVTNSNLCFTCGCRIMVKDEIPYNFCSILCKLIYEAGDDKIRVDALTAPLKIHDQDSVFAKEEEEVVKERSSALGTSKGTDLINEVKEKKKKKKKKNEGRRSSGVVVKSKLGVSRGGIKKPENEMSKGEKLAACPVVRSFIIEDIKVNNGGKKISGLKRMMEMEEQEKLKNKEAKKMINKRNNKKEINDDEKLQSLISAALNDDHVHVKLQGFRKRSRKGIQCRAPLY